MTLKHKLKVICLLLILSVLFNSCATQISTKAEQPANIYEIRNELADKIKSELMPLISGIKIVDNVTVDMDSEQVKIAVEVFNDYKPQDISALFNNIGYYLNDIYYFQNWLDQKNVSTEILDIQDIDFNLSFTTKKHKILYEMIQSTDPGQINTRGNPYSQPRWLALKWPAGEEPFSFIYSDIEPSNITNSMTETLSLNNIDAFSWADIMEIRDVLGFTLEDDINTILHRYKPIDTEIDFFVYQRIYFYFDFGWAAILSCYNYTVEAITIDRNNELGPRGTRLGDHYRDVIAKYPITVTDNNEMLYQLTGSATSSEGHIVYDETGSVNAIVFTYKEGDYWCRLEFDIQKDVVVSITLYQQGPED